MYTRTALTSAVLCGLAAAAPAPQGTPAAYEAATFAADNQAGTSPGGYPNADATWVPESPAAITPLASEFDNASDVSATFTTPVTTGTAAAGPQRSSIVTGATSHGPYDGEAATTTGAVYASVVDSTIPMLPPNPTATYYNQDGKLVAKAVRQAMMFDSSHESAAAKSAADTADQTETGK